MNSHREPKRSAPEDPLRPDPKRPKMHHPDITRPTKRQVKYLKKDCREAALPLWPVRAARAALGHSPVYLGAGTSGIAFLNPAKNLVVKFCVDIDAFNSAVGEAKVMQTLRAVPGVQRLVGICPKRFVMVT